VLLEADWILPVSGPPFANGGIAVADGRIAEVGPAAELRARWGGDGQRTFPGCVLMPGLVNVHSHLEYSAFHNFSRSCGFGEWMLRLLMARRKLAVEDYAVSARWGARECVRAGMTFLADTSFEGWTSAHAAGEAGVRARVHLEIIGMDDADLPQIMERMESRLAILRDACGPLVEPGLSPHAPYTVSPRLYRELTRYARRNDLRLATHVAESKAEVELLKHGTGAIAQAYKAAHLWKGQRWSPPGVSPVALLRQSEALGPETLAVHCVQLDAVDIAVLAASGATVAHCPRSNGRLQCGTAPVSELRRAGVVVGLGTDSLASNETLDLFAEMRMAVDYSRARATAGHASSVGRVPGPAPRFPGAVAHTFESVDDRCLDDEAVLKMATLEGAAALGLDDRVGSLDAGKLADIIAVQLSREAPAGSDLLSLLATRTTAANVQMTMIEGRIVFERPAAPVGRDDLDLAFIGVQKKLGVEGGTAG
jgi:cytosine/adenosine deaminase-related metal-dependent hydrolase